jgi:hypothetical protein
MKRVIVIFYLLSWCLCASAQGVKNGGFESHSSGCKNPPNGNPSDFSDKPFGDGVVNYWNASHGSPQITKLTCNATLLDNEVGIGSSSAFIDGRRGVNMEGIFQAVNFAKDESFNFTIVSRSFNGIDSLFVELTTGLTNFTSGATTLSLPTVSKRQLVLAVPVTTTWTTFRVDEFVIDDDYDQIWIYGTDGSIFVDGVVASKSCCEPYQVWQNITNPPSTYVNNYIKAGENVDSTQPTGKVIITANSEPVKFEAGQHIELLPGFETEPGATFVAEIKDCGEKEFEISINEIAPWVPTGSIEPTCFKAFEVSACFGSGKYSYSWDNGFGTNRTNPYFANRSENIDLTSPQWLFVTAIDEVTNDTIREGFHISATPFTGSFSFDLFNAITPNGDGINDTWAVIDSTKLGSDSFGYNAYHYVLNLFTRFAPSVHCAENGEDATRGPNQPKNKVGTNKTKGFAFDEIDWIINDYCSWAEHPEMPYTLFGCLRLENCSQATNFSFTITVFCSSGTTIPYELSIDDSLNNESSILIFPNPSTNILNISSEAQELKGIQLFDSRGLLIKDIGGQSKLLTSLPLDGVSSGNYILRIVTMENKTITKVVIIK